MNPQIQTGAGMQPGKVQPGKVQPGKELLARHHRFAAEQLRAVFVQVYRMVENVVDAQTLTQEAFIHAADCLDQLEEKGRAGRKAAAWLARTATSAAISFFRRGQPKPGGELEPDAQPERGGKLAPLWVPGRRRKHIEAGLRALTPRERAALILRDVEGLPAAEVAKRLDCSPAAARIHIANARNKVRGYASGVAGCP